VGISLLLACTVPVLISTRADPQDWPAEAFEVLGRFVGEWETQTVIRHDDPPIREFQTRGRGTGRKTLEGRYFEFRSWSIPPGQAELQIMTYDIAAGLYRQWVFDSDGYHHEAEGRWEPSTSTLRWEGQRDGAFFVIEDRWTAPDRLEWTLRRTGSDGRRLQTITGVLTRVGESPK
jgi:hypothetical protein